MFPDLDHRLFTFFSLAGWARETRVMLAAWLDTVRGGMGEHVAVLVDYGVESFRDVGDLDEDDIAKICSKFEANGVKPLHSKKICEALHVRMLEEKAKAEGVKAGADKAAADKAPAKTTPAASARRASFSRPTSSTAHGHSRCDSSDGNESDRSWHKESDPESNDDEEAAPKRRVHGNVTARPRPRVGKKRMSKADAAAAEGRGALFGMFSRSTSCHGYGAQANAASANAGRARLLARLSGRKFGQLCTKICGSVSCVCLPEAEERCIGAQECARRLTSFLAGAEAAAKRTPSEIVKHGTTNSKYNYARLIKGQLATSSSHLMVLLARGCCLGTCASSTSESGKECEGLSVLLCRGRSHQTPLYWVDLGPTVSWPFTPNTPVLGGSLTLGTRRALVQP